MDILLDIELYVTTRTYYLRQQNLLKDLVEVGKKASKNKNELETKKSEISKRIAESEAKIRELDSKIMIELSMLDKVEQREVLAKLESDLAFYQNKRADVSLMLEVTRNANGLGNFKGERFNCFLRPTNLDDDYFELEDQLLSITVRLQDYGKLLPYLQSLSLGGGNGLKKN